MVRRDLARDVLRGRLGDSGAAAVVTVIFDADSVYGLIADETLARLPWNRRPRWSHGLCVLLEQAAAAVTPGTYVAVLEEALRDVLLRAGMPRFLAKAIAVAIGLSASRLIGSLGTDQIVTLLRTLVLLVCPNFERCPTQQTVCTFFARPSMEDTARSILTH